MLLVFANNMSDLPEGKYVNDGSVNYVDVKRLVESALDEPITIYVVKGVKKVPISERQRKLLALNGKLVYVDRNDIRDVVEQCNYKRILVIIPSESGFTQYRRETRQLSLW